MTTYSLLILTPGAASWQELSLPQPRPNWSLAIGRAPGNQLVLNDPLVSDRHAVLRLDNEGIFVCAESSASAVLVEGQPIPAGQWLALAEGATITLGGTRLRLKSAQETPQPGPRRFPLWLMFLVGGALLACCSAAVLVLWFQGDYLVSLVQSPPAAQADLPTTVPPSPDAANPPVQPPTGPARTLQTLPLTNGQTQTDANGVGVSLPAGALPGAAAQVSAAELQGQLAAELTQAYELLSPAYTLAAQSADSQKPATLRFPAASPDLRVMAVIDGAYAALLGAVPENGILTVSANIPPAEMGSLAGKAPMWGSGSIQYLLVRPTGQGSLPSSARLAALLHQDTPYPCISLTRARCWQNGNASVQLMMDRDISLTPSAANIVINYIQSIMDNYEALGFDGAIYTAGKPVQVVVTKENGIPHYLVATGVIYLPNDVASKIAGGGEDTFLVHELGHWVQDSSYCMYCAFASGPDTWWIEASAENMVMLAIPTYTGQNLAAYGAVDVSGKYGVLQSAPYQWPINEFYAQAQQVKVNMCPDMAVCPLSQEAFIAEINNGGFPYALADVQQKLHVNLPDYARYLLGLAPQKANTAIPLDTVESGDNYGDIVRLVHTQRGTLSLSQRTQTERLTEETQGGIAALKVEAPIQKDGVYVLRVEVGQGGGYASLPTALKVEPGAPFYYRVNNGEVLFHDGKSVLTLQPLMQGKSGKEITSLRLAAVGQQGGEVFKARIGLVDLSGLWFLNLPDESTWKTNITCQKGDDGSTVAKLGTTAAAVGFIAGDFRTDEFATGLTWAPAPSRLAAFTSSGLTLTPGSVDDIFTGMAVINPDEILVSTKLIIGEEPGATYADPKADYVQAIQIPGTITASSAFPVLEYIGSEEKVLGSPHILAWKLSGGKLIFTFDNTLLDQYMYNTGALRRESRNPCKGTVEVDGIISIYQEKK